MSERFRNTTKRLVQPLLARWMAYYYRKPRIYRYDKVEILVHPEVFPPKFTLSTRILLDFIAVQELEGKTLLELGCGSGIVSLYAASKGANVTASDINLHALNYLKKSAEKQSLKVEVLYSDLFEEIETSYFDRIIINPPYYPKQPEDIKEQAWFCGPEFEYFESLFSQLSSRKDAENVWMILSQDCDFGRIESIAAKNHIRLTPIHLTSKLGEKNTIYKTKR